MHRLLPVSFQCLSPSLSTLHFRRHRATAAAVVIATEVLTGKVQDTNSKELASTLFNSGVKLNHIEVIHDDAAEIARTVKRASSKHDFVFTSGGIGCTHDDITYASIARAFKRSLQLHEPTVAAMKAHYGDRLKTMNTENLYIMATLPTPCEIIKTPGLWVPLVVVENVYILPGVPQLFAPMLQAAKPRFAQKTAMARQLLYTTTFESEMAQHLRLAKSKFGDVDIGSYPQFLGPKKVLVTLSMEGESEIDVSHCALMIRTLINCYDTKEEALATLDLTKSTS